MIEQISDLEQGDIKQWNDLCCKCKVDNLAKYQWSCCPKMLGDWEGDWR